MKYILYIALFAMPAWLLGQSAQDIVQKHFEVTGGTTHWNQLNSIKITGLVAVGVSETVPIIIEHKRPYFKRVSYIIDGKEMLNEGYDGKNAYTYDESSKKYKRLVRYAPDAFETDLLNYQKKGFKLSLEGREKVHGVDTYKIKLTKNTIEDYYWFDVNSYQILKESNAIETTYYYDFKTFGGLSFSTRLEIQPKGGEEYVVIFDNIYPNASIENHRFNFN